MKFPQWLIATLIFIIGAVFWSLIPAFINDPVYLALPTLWYDSQLYKVETWLLAGFCGLMVAFIWDEKINIPALSCIGLAPFISASIQWVIDYVVDYYSGYIYTYSLDVGPCMYCLERFPIFYIQGLYFVASILMIIFVRNTIRLQLNERKGRGGYWLAVVWVMTALFIGAYLWAKVLVLTHQYVWPVNPDIEFGFSNLFFLESLSYNLYYPTFAFCFLAYFGVKQLSTVDGSIPLARAGIVLILMTIPFLNYFIECCWLVLNKWGILSDFGMLELGAHSIWGNLFLRSLESQGFALGYFNFFSLVALALYSASEWIRKD